MGGGPCTAALGRVALGERCQVATVAHSAPGRQPARELARVTAADRHCPVALCPRGRGRGGHSEGGAGAQEAPCPPNSRFCCPAAEAAPRTWGPRIAATRPGAPAALLLPGLAMFSVRPFLQPPLSIAALWPAQKSARPLLSQDSFHMHPSCEVPAAGPEARVAQPGRSGTLGSAGLGPCPDCGSQAQAMVSEPPWPLPT